MTLFLSDIRFWWIASILQIFDATDPAFQPPADFLELSEAELRMRGVYLVESHLCIKRLMGSRPSEVMSLLGTGVALKGILEDLDAAFPATATIYVATQASLERVMGYQVSWKSTIWPRFRSITWFETLCPQGNLPTLIALYIWNKTLLVDAMSRIVNDN